MKTHILASGSDGNCIAISHAEGTILIDAGIAKTKIEKRLSEVGIRPDQIDAIFITHAHADHIKGLALANKYSIPVYATNDEWKGISGVKSELARILHTRWGDYEIVNINDTFIHPFKVYHDAYEPVGYKVSDGNSRIGVVLDTGKVDIDILDYLTECETIIIEANHDEDMLAESSYPDSLKARILSDIGHLSNQQTAEALVKVLKFTRCDKVDIIINHMSKNNNMPELARMTVVRALKKSGFIEGQEYTLEVI